MSTLSETKDIQNRHMLMMTVADAAFVNSSVTTGKRVVTTRVGSIGITTIMVHFKESFEKVCVVDDP